MYINYRLNYILRLDLGVCHLESLAFAEFLQKRQKEFSFQFSKSCKVIIEQFGIMARKRTCGLFSYFHSSFSSIFMRIFTHTKYKITTENLFYRSITDRPMDKIIVERLEGSAPKNMTSIFKSSLVKSCFFKPMLDGHLELESGIVSKTTKELNMEISDFLMVIKLDLLNLALYLKQKNNCL